jgi:hypothetical protein
VKQLEAEIGRFQGNNNRAEERTLEAEKARLALMAEKAAFERHREGELAELEQVSNINTNENQYLLFN